MTDSEARPPDPAVDPQDRDRQKRLRRWKVRKAIRRFFLPYLWMGILSALLFSVLPFVFWEPSYEASAWLQIENTKPYVAFPDRQISRRYVETQKQLIRSPMVLGQVVSDPRIARLSEIAEMDDPFDGLREKLKVETVGDSEILRVSYAGPKPQNAADIVNAVTDSYLTLHAESESARTQQVIKMLQQKQAAEANRLRGLQDKYRALSEKLTGENPFVKETKVKTDPLDKLQDRLADIEFERMFLQAQATVLAQEIKDEKIDVPEALLEKTVADDPAIQKLRAEIAASRAIQADLMKIVRGKEDPRYRQEEEKIQQIEQTLQEIWQDVRQGVQRNLKTAILSERKDALAAMQTSVREYEQMEKTLKDRCGVKEKDRTAEAGYSVALEFQRSELERAEKVYDLIAERLEHLQTERNAPSRVSLYSKAVVPTDSAGGLPFLSMAVAAVIGLFFPVLVGLVIGSCKWLLQPWRIDDPVFGRMLFYPPEDPREPGFWRCLGTLDSEEEVIVVVHADQGGPTEAQRRTFRELWRRYPELKSPIGEAMSQLCRLSGDTAAALCLRTPPAGLRLSENFWDHIWLRGLHVEATTESSPPEVMLAYAFSWDEEHTVNVFLSDWRVVRTAVVSGQRTEPLPPL